MTGSVLVTRPAPAGAANVVPGQWIAKIYSEGLGRAPDQGAWSNMVAFFQSSGCSAATLAQKGEQIYLSGEFTALGHGNAARLLALYRGALNREPDPSGFSFNLNQLNNNTPWSDMVDRFFASSEFNNHIASFCTAGSYSFGTAAAISIPLGQSCSGQFCFTGGTQAQLQTMLNAAAPTHATVTLAQQVVVPITTAHTIGPPRRRPVGLDIPAGVTLTTVGQPPVAQYAKMGRLVRASSLGTAAVVEVESGARLLNVWVDGQRGDPANHVAEAVNVETAGGSGTTVSNNRISNTVGFTNLHALGTAESLPCASNVIKGNVVTAYSSGHDGGLWADGLSVACENADVEGNTVIDATDVGIVLFRAGTRDPARNPAQRSIVRNNTLLSAGSAAFGGIVADPLQMSRGNNPSPSFAGSSVDHNTLWTSPTTFFEIGLSVGSAAWFSSPSTGSGASFTSNTTGSLSANVTEGIGVSGMRHVTVTGNTLNVIPSPKPGTTCPQGVIVVDPARSSGNVQQPFTNGTILACV